MDQLFKGVLRVLYVAGIMDINSEKQQLKGNISRLIIHIRVYKLFFHNLKNLSVICIFRTFAGIAYERILIHLSTGEELR